MRLTKAQCEYVLKTIAGYVLPTYTFDGQPFVPLRAADALRTMAKEALKGETP